MNGVTGRWNPTSIGALHVAIRRQVDRAQRRAPRFAGTVLLGRILKSSAAGEEV